MNNKKIYIFFLLHSVHHKVFCIERKEMLIVLVPGCINRPWARSSTRRRTRRPRSSNRSRTTRNQTSEMWHSDSFKPIEGFWRLVYWSMPSSVEWYNRHVAVYVSEAERLWGLLERGWLKQVMGEMDEYIGYVSYIYIVEVCCNKIMCWTCREIFLSFFYIGYLTLTENRYIWH